MKKQKYYLIEDDDQMLTKDEVIDVMKENKLSEINVTEWVKDTDKNMLYCKAIDEVCDNSLSDYPCGKTCGLYEPRNGKNGCCKHRRHALVPGDMELIMHLDGKTFVVMTN